MEPETRQTNIPLGPEIIEDKQAQNPGKEQGPRHLITKLRVNKRKADFSREEVRFFRAAIDSKHISQKRFTDQVPPMPPRFELGEPPPEDKAAC